MGRSWQSELKICSWNIAGLKDKLQNLDVLNFLLDFDIVWLSEIKSTLQRSVPGFDLYMNKCKENDHRGGVMMMVKCALAQFVTRVDMKTEGQIWLEMSCWPGVLLGGVYIPPEDSPYHQPAHLGALAGRIAECERVVIVGDLNARVGKPIIRNENDELYNYYGVKDFTVNNMGRSVIQMCNDNDMVVANHLKYENKQLGGNLSFRRTQWISEIDLCLVKKNVISMITDLNVRQDVKGSDHAPLTVSLDMKNYNIYTSLLLENASSLGGSYMPSSNNDCVLKSPKCDDVNIDEFTSRLAQCVPPDINVMTQDSVSEVVTAACSAISGIAKECVGVRLERESIMEPSSLGGKVY